jgi:hypothetical protein
MVPCVAFSLTRPVFQREVNAQSPRVPSLTNSHELNTQMQAAMRALFCRRIVHLKPDNKA